MLGGDVKFNGDGSADITETWTSFTIAEIRSQAIGPSAYATGMFATTLYYQTYKIEPSRVTNVMSDSYKQTDVIMGSMADDTIRNFNGTIYLRDTRYSNGIELVAGMGNAVIAYEIKKTQERPVYHLSNSAQLLPILAENGYDLRILPINWQPEAGTIYGGTVTLNEDRSADLVNTWVLLNMSNYSIGDQVTGTTKKSFNIRVRATGSSYYKARSKAICSDFPFKGYSSWSSFSNPDAMDDGLWLYSGSDNIFYFVADKDYAVNSKVAVELKDSLKTRYHFDNIGQLNSFLGTNNIWHDMNGDITVEYWNKQ